MYVGVKSFNNKGICKCSRFTYVIAANDVWNYSSLKIVFDFWLWFLDQMWAKSCNVCC